jgi:hypothetical protein
VCLSGTWVKRGSKTGRQEGIMLLNVQNKLTTVGSTFTIIGGGMYDHIMHKSVHFDNE